jgi:hypothetical protein
VRARASERARDTPTLVGHAHSRWGRWVGDSYPWQGGGRCGGGGGFKSNKTRGEAESVYMNTERKYISTERGYANTERGYINTERGRGWGGFARIEAGAGSYPSQRGDFAGGAEGLGRSEGQ